MIFAFENLKDFDKKLVRACEPYIDFNYSLQDGCYYWQRYHLIIGGKNIYKLRLHKAENLKQGLICTDFDEAKWLSMLIEGTNSGGKLKNGNKWLEAYLKEKKNDPGLKVIALPVSEYIKYYSNDFKMLKLLDFEKIFSFRSK